MLNALPSNITGNNQRSGRVGDHVILLEWIDVVTIDVVTLFSPAICFECDHLESQQALGKVPANPTQNACVMTSCLLTHADETATNRRPE
jgi:hypothetical protein